jgi:integrase
VLSSNPAIIHLPPFSARKRGKRMSRRSGQNPAVRVGKRANGEKYYFFQYWSDIPGQAERRRETETVGLVKQMTRSEAERRKLEFISNLKLNSSGYQIPSSATFAHAVKHYRETFAPRMLRASTYSIADGHLKTHLEDDWNEVPVEHINIDSVNEWMWKKRQAGLTWTTIKNILRTMQRVLSAFSKDRKPPFSQQGLTIPDRDKLQMKIESREAVSFSWLHAKSIAAHVRTQNWNDERREQYATLFLLASASGLRFGELVALRLKDINLKAKTIRVDESSDQRNAGKVGPCKNVAAYRTVLLADAEGREALKALERFLATPKPFDLLFCSRRGTPLLETNVLHDGLHPALKALNLPKAGMHAFRHGTNRRWELSGLNPAVLRQQMGHSSATMTARYTGEVPMEQVKAAFTNGTKIVVLEHMENEAAA